MWNERPLALVIDDSDDTRDMYATALDLGVQARDDLAGDDDVAARGAAQRAEVAGEDDLCRLNIVLRGE